MCIYFIRLMEMAAAESLRESGGMEEDDDAEYYRQEVGEEPEHGNLGLLYHIKSLPKPCQILC